MLNQNWPGEVLGSTHQRAQTPSEPKDRHRVHASKIHALPLPFLHRVLRLTALPPRKIESQVSDKQNRFP
jgi:hypothetical protein